MAYLFIIIFGFVVGLSYPLGIEPLFFKPLFSSGGVLVLTILYLVAGWWLARRLRFKFLSHTVNDKTGTVIYKLITLYRFSLLVIYILEIYVLHWPLIVTYSLGINIILLNEFLILSPFLVALVVSWIPLWQIDCTSRQVTWKLSEYLIFHIRTSLLLVLIPLFGLVLLIDMVSILPFLNELVFIYPFTLWLIALLLLLIMYILAPLYLKTMWRLQSLPAGPLRRRLESLVNQSGLSIRDFLVWRIGRGRLANALVMGLIPQLRYVVFTDTLLNQFTPEEVEAVLGHEIGHAKQRHLLFYFLMAVLYVLMAISVEGMAGGSALSATLNILLLIIIFWGVLFRVVAHHLEKAADLYSAQLLNKSGPTGGLGFVAMINALEKLVLVNGTSRKLRDLMHPSVAKRVEFLRRIEAMPTQELIFRKSMRPWLIFLSIFFALSLLGVIQGIRDQFHNVPEQKVRLEAIRLGEEARLLLFSAEELPEDDIPGMMDKYDNVIKLLKQAIALDNSNPYYYLLLGEAITMQAGIPTPEARVAYEAAQRLNPVEPLQRMYLAEQLGR